MEECCICCQKFQQRTDKIVIIKHNNDDNLSISRKRGHYFHNTCIQRWRDQHGTCPLDRDPISKLYSVPEYQVLGLELGLYNYDYSDLLANVKVNDILLDQISNINDVDKHNRSLVFYACKLGNYSLVSKLLKRGGDFNLPCGNEGFTPLMVAICYYHSKITIMLLANRSVQDKINCADHTGNTAFSYACSTMQLDVIKEFIRWKLVLPGILRYNLDLLRPQFKLNGSKGQDIINLLCKSMACV